MENKKRGYVQVYTGDGKGKTTAAIGLAIRASGAGLNVYIAQFIKQGDYSEIRALKKLADLIFIEQFGLGRFVEGKPSKDDIISAQNGLQKAKQIMLSNEYDIIILDEANVAQDLGLFSQQDLLDVISAKPEHVEMIITGRRASTPILDCADLVTEMKPVKHYYEKGVKARVGIEK
jgi:cob(I)alamin adenosyltransferase